MKLEDYDITTQYAAQLLTNERLTSESASAEVRELAIEIESEEFRARVGENIGVLAPGLAEMGQRYHFRLYSIADVPLKTDSGRQILKICVRRCTYIDEYSGERFDGVASNYLCDRAHGDQLTITGPYGQAFEVPSDSRASLILIGAGTGIAPFRAFVKHLYHDRSDFDGRVILFHGGETGLDLLYRNQEKDDFASYYDRDTFEAINALGRRPGWSSTIDWGSAIKQRSDEVCKLLADSSTYVYIAGLRSIMDELDCVLAETAGSNEQWQAWKSELKAENRWVELLY